MVSFRNSISSMDKNTFSNMKLPSKKRKLEEEEEEEEDMEENLQSSTLYVELHLDKPLPLDWQQCLNLQSGQIDFYNTRTKRRTCKDPRYSPQQLSSSPMSLDLELNLPYQSHIDDTSGDQKIDKSLGLPTNNSCSDSIDRSHSLSSMAFDRGQEEMVAAACKHCHMLVMLSKAYPECPNCKFMNQIDHNGTSYLLKTRLSLLCCED